MGAKSAALERVALGNLEGKSWKAELQPNASAQTLFKAAKSLLKKSVAESLTKCFTDLTEDARTLQIDRERDLKLEFWTLFESVRVCLVRFSCPTSLE